MAIMQMLRPQRTTYMASWMIGFVQRALAGKAIHWAQILWHQTRLHATVKNGRSANSNLTMFFIDFYRTMGSLTAAEKLQFPLLSRAASGRYVKDVEVDTYPNKVLVATPRVRIVGRESRRSEQPQRKRKRDEVVSSDRRGSSGIPVKRRTANVRSRPKAKA